MSGYSESADCPRCDGKDTLDRSVDRDDITGFCSECGYSYTTVYKNLTLEEVNEERKACQMEPLAELKKPVEGWTDETN